MENQFIKRQFSCAFKQKETDTVILSDLLSAMIKVFEKMKMAGAKRSLRERAAGSLVVSSGELGAAPPTSKMHLYYKCTAGHYFVVAITR